MVLWPYNKIHAGVCAVIVIKKKKNYINYCGWISFIAPGAALGRKIEP